ncbi:MAG TPA: TetR family transcriptional regulator [Microbacterium sp.]|uniref:TetR/AcrR family transcriptional regulator n=1 Tax=Microbacterium sp. TaxID=51671 RepID=UPI002BEE216E|nr:TetR family transcriptional regulator [Microbacterium sp.]HWI30617.1 TetR family transcriptional regulator [Microbacterium sp.]
MAHYAVPTPRRRRGRPSGGDSGTRERVVSAAIEEFGEHGYDGATMRGIAARAGVDAALLHHYFGTKADLFGETIGAPLRPDLAIPEILERPRDEIGEAIVRYLLEAWEVPETRKRGIVLLRSAIGNKLATPLLAGFLSRELIGKIAARLDTPDAELRAALVASQVAGLLIARYVLRLAPLAEASVDDLVAKLAPTVQGYLFD